MNKFLNFLESMREANPLLVESLIKAYTLIEAQNINKNFMINKFGENAFNESKQRVDDLWQKHQMNTFIKKSDKILNFLYFIEASKNNIINDDVMNVLHDMASANMLANLDSLNSDTTPNEFSNFISEQKRKLNNLGDLTKEEECIWLRVKTLHDFGDGFKWVVALDENGEVTGYIPSKISQKTAMHCGNEPSKESGDRYYELRKENKPYITVILDEEGKIAESKPVGNSKISIDFSEVKEYFKWLLKHEDMTGVGDRYEYGYAPDQNYGVKDFVGIDDEFVDEISKSKPNALGTQEKYIIDLKRKYLANQISENDVIKLFKYTKLRLWEVRAVLGKIPFNEQQIMQYIESERLTTVEIANTSTKLLTRNIQEQCLQYDDKSGSILFNIYNNVPRNNIDLKLVIELRPNMIYRIPENDRIKFLKDNNLIQSFGKGLETYPSAIQYIHENERIEFLQDNKLTQSFGKGIENDNYSIKFIPENELLKFLQDNNLIQSFGKVFENEPHYIEYIPENERVNFLQDNNLIQSFGIILQEKPNSINYIHENERIKFLKDNNLMQSFSKGLEENAYSIYCIPENERINFLQDNKLTQSFGKGFETRPSSILYIPENDRIKFLKDNDLMQSFGKGLQQDAYNIIYIPENERIEFLKDNDLMQSFGKGLQNNSRAIYYISDDVYKRMEFMKLLGLS